MTLVASEYTDLEYSYDTTPYIHALVKINLVREGYLPNYPYHLISDAEMCDAFMDNGKGYFYDRYPCIVPEYVDKLNETGPYDNLTRAIRYYINELKTSKNPSYTMPDWVYSYMLGKVIGKDSDVLDIHDLLVPLHVDNIDDEFTREASIACYEVSKDWLRRTRPNTYEGNVNGLDSRYVEFENKKTDLRPPTMFGEAHVIKSIRLSELSPLDLI